MEIGSLYYDLNIDDKKLKSQLDSADKAVKGFGEKINAYWGDSVDASRKFGLALTAVGAGVVAFGVKSVKAFEDSQNRIAQTNAVLKSTGQIAGVTADAVTKLATSLERQTKFSDEDVRSVENLLLTFTSIGKDIFPQATKTVLDMATALGEDTKSASIQLGKALQDPILGVTALRRVGVNFNQAQQEVIANLVNTGQSAKAQQLIMAELTKEFGGSAEAAGGTLSGQLAKLKNQFNNVQEAIGGILATVATPFLDALLKWFDRIGGVDGVLKLLRQELDQIRPYFPYIAGAIIGMLVPAIIAMTIAAAEFVLVMAPWAALGIGLVQLFLHWGQVVQYVTTTVSGLWAAFTNNAVIIILGQYIQQVLWPALQAVAAAIVQNLWPAFKQLWAAVVQLWNALNPALMDALKVIGAIMLGGLLVAIYALVAGLNLFVQIISMVITFISYLIGNIASAIGAFGSFLGMVRNVVAIIATIAWNIPGAFGAALNTTFAIIRGIMGGLVNTIWGFFGMFVDAGWGLIRAFAHGITGAAGEAYNAVKAVASKVRNLLPFSDAKEGPLSSLTLSGQRFSETFAGGIIKGASAIHSAVNSSLSGMNSAVLAPNINMTPGAVNAGNTTTYGDTVVNIGAINNQQDESYVLRRLDRNSQLEGMGISPIAGMA